MRLRALTSQSDDPAYLGQLAGLILTTGNSGEAQGLIDEASRRFDDLEEQSPGAFTLKAARFWMGPGGNPGKALVLAQRNAEHRHRYEDRQLLNWAQAAARQDARP